MCCVGENQISFEVTPKKHNHNAIQHKSIVDGVACKNKHAFLGWFKEEVKDILFFK